MAFYIQRHDSRSQSSGIRLDCVVLKVSTVLSEGYQTLPKTNAIFKYEAVRMLYEFSAFHVIATSELKSNLTSAMLIYHFVILKFTKSGEQAENGRCSFQTCQATTSSTFAYPLISQEQNFMT
jgi:hypothetical protein